MKVNYEQTKAIYASRLVPDGAKVLYAVLSGFSKSGDKVVSPSDDRLALSIGKSSPSIRRLLSDLINCSAISIRWNGEQRDIEIREFREPKRKIRNQYEKRKIALESAQCCSKTSATLQQNKRNVALPIKVSLASPLLSPGFSPGAKHPPPSKRKGEHDASDSQATVPVPTRRESLGVVPANGAANVRRSRNNAHQSQSDLQEMQAVDECEIAQGVTHDPRSQVHVLEAHVVREAVNPQDESRCGAVGSDGEQRACDVPRLQTEDRHAEDGLDGYDSHGEHVSTEIGARPDLQHEADNRIAEVNSVSVQRELQAVPEADGEAQGLKSNANDSQVRQGNSGGCAGSVRGRVLEIPGSTENDYGRKQSELQALPKDDHGQVNHGGKDDSHRNICDSRRIGVGEDRTILFGDVPVGRSTYGRSMDGGGASDAEVSSTGRCLPVTGGRAVLHEVTKGLAAPSNGGSHARFEQHLPTREEDPALVPERPAKTGRGSTGSSRVFAGEWMDGQGTAADHQGGLDASCSLSSRESQRVPILQSGGAATFSQNNQDTCQGYLQAVPPQDRSRAKESRLTAQQDAGEIAEDSASRSGNHSAWTPTPTGGSLPSDGSARTESPRPVIDGKEGSSHQQQDGKCLVLRGGTRSSERNRESRHAGISFAEKQDGSSGNPLTNSDYSLIRTHFPLGMDSAHVQQVDSLEAGEPAITGSLSGNKLSQDGAATTTMSLRRAKDGTAPKFKASSKREFQKRMENPLPQSDDPVDIQFLKYAQACFSARYRNQNPRWTPMDWGRIAEKIQGDLDEAKLRWDNFAASTLPWHANTRLSLKHFLNEYDAFIDGPVHGSKPSTGERKTAQQQSHEAFLQIFPGGVR